MVKFNQLRRLIVLALSTSALLFCAACADNNFPKYIQLGDLRILTLKANQSEVNPGTSGITIQPVVSDITAGGRTLNVTIQTCADPGISLGAAPACLVVDSNQTSSFSTSTLSSNGTFTGSAPTFTVNVPSSPSNYASANANSQYNGVPYLVFYTLTSTDGTSVTAFKRIIVSSPAKSSKNQNPVISSLTANGAPLTAVNTFTSVLQNLSIAFSVSPEIYNYMNPDASIASQAEIYTTSWFYSDGSDEFTRTTNTDPNQWTPPAAHPTGRASVLVVITRDSRDGEDFQKYEFN